jgi:hypothetical protein
VKLYRWNRSSGYQELIASEPEEGTSAMRVTYQAALRHLDHTTTVEEEGESELCRGRVLRRRATSNEDPHVSVLLEHIANDAVHVQHRPVFTLYSLRRTCSHYKSVNKP